ncbi:MAG: ATP-dependent zinc metalloprotease FtsH [Mycoplasmataceae bacterium]|nr:MAG: ATP-dependent zinc metalloprotease FtsH [Mycoplasmataceae bacterium]
MNINKNIFSKKNNLWNLKLFLNKRLKKFLIIWRFSSIVIYFFILSKIEFKSAFKNLFETVQSETKSNLASILSISSVLLFLFSLISYFWLKITEIVPNFVKSVNLESSQFENIFRNKFFLINESKFNLIKVESIVFSIKDASNLVNVNGKIFSTLEDGKFEFYFNSNLHSNSLPYFLERISKDNFFNDLNFKFKRSNELSLFSVKGILIAFISINSLIISYKIGKWWISYVQEQNAIQEDKNMRWSPINSEDLSSFEESVAGYDQIVSDLKSNANSISKGRGIILYGPPGTGKTLLAKCYAKVSNFSYMFCAAGEDLQVNAISNITGISSSKGKLIELLDWVLEKSKGMRSLVFIDEIDKMGSKIAGIDGLSSGGIEFLNIIDGVYDKKYKSIFFIMTTNYVEWFNEACLRSGRLEHQYNVNYPNFESSYKIINHYFNYFEENSSEFGINVSKIITSNKLNIINFIYYSINRDVINKNENLEHIHSLLSIKEIWKIARHLRIKEKFNEETIIKIVNNKINIFEAYGNYGNNFEITKDYKFTNPNFEIDQYEEKSFEKSNDLNDLSKFTGSDIKSLILNFLERFNYWEEKIGSNPKFHLVWKLEFFNILEKGKKSSSSKNNVLGNALKSLSNFR